MRLDITTSKLFMKERKMPESTLSVVVSEDSMNWMMDVLGNHAFKEVGERIFAIRQEAQVLATRINEEKSAWLKEREQLIGEITRLGGTYPPAPSSEETPSVSG